MKKMATVPRPEELARVYGHPGEGSRSAGWMRLIRPLLAAAVLGGYLIRCAWPRPEISSTVAGLLLLALAFILMGLVRRGEQQLRDFLKGAAGEERLARLLSLLPRSFAVFHSVQGNHRGGGGGDLDHVVVGPPGIFLIETKNWADRVELRNGVLLYKGQEPDRPPLKQAAEAARMLEKRLAKVLGQEITVQPILCFVSNVFSGGESGQSGVMICNADRLHALLTESRERVLNDSNVRQIEDALRASISRLHE